MVGAYYRRLTGQDEEQRLLCAKHWSGWEMATSRLHIDEKMLQKTENNQWSLQFACIEWYAYTEFTVLIFSSGSTPAELVRWGFCPSSVWPSVCM